MIGGGVINFFTIIVYSGSRKLELQEALGQMHHLILWTANDPTRNGMLHFTHHMHSFGLAPAQF